MEKAWLDRFRTLLPAAPSVLDLGCGAGQPIGRYLLEQGTALTGVDTSPELIGMARDALPEGLWEVADMRRLARDETFDGVLAWNSFFHLTPDDQRAMFPIFEHHCADGGGLMFTSGTGEGVAMGCFEGEPLYHSSLDPVEYRSLLDRHGFDVIDHVVEDPDCGQLTIWLCQRR